MLLLAATKNLYDAYEGKFDRYHTRNLYDFIAGQHIKHILMWISFEPTYAFYERRDPIPGIIIHGRIAPESSPRATFDAILDNYPGVAESAQGRTTLSILKKRGRLDLYTDWLISKAPSHEVTLLAMADTQGPEEAEVIRSMARRGCSGGVVYTGSYVKALSLVCP